MFSACGCISNGRFFRFFPSVELSELNLGEKSSNFDQLSSKPDKISSVPDQRLSGGNGVFSGGSHKKVPYDEK